MFFSERLESCFDNPTAQNFGTPEVMAHCSFVSSMDRAEEPRVVRIGSRRAGEGTACGIHRCLKIVTAILRFLQDGCFATVCKHQVVLLGGRGG